MKFKDMVFRKCGASGLYLPAVSLGLWQNFGSNVPFDTCREIILKAYDIGITHFDAANNYGPEPGSAESNLGAVLRSELSAHRDQIIVSTKAGFDMWPGPYGNGGSKKYLVASLDQSLKRLGLEYVDIFYHHIYDPDTDVSEVAHTLETVVRQGKALYAGVSNYSAQQTEQLHAMLKSVNIPLIIHQPYYNMLDRGAEQGLLPNLAEMGMGSIAYCPLAQGILTDKFLGGIPADSRVGRSEDLKGELTPQRVKQLNQLADLARQRGQKLSQLAIAYLLQRVTSVLIGVSRTEQLLENAAAVKNLEFSAAELAEIERILQQ